MMGVPVEEVAPMGLAYQPQGMKKRLLAYK